MKPTHLFYRFLTRISLPLSLCCFFGFSTSCEGEIEPPYTISKEMLQPFPETHGYYSSMGGWSPDGTKIVFNGHHSYGKTIEIYDIETKEITIVATQVLYNLRWSPDWKMILGCTALPGADIYLFNLEHRTFTKLTGSGTPINPHRQARYRIQWHPSGNSYVFHGAGATAMGVPYAIYATNLDGSGLRMIIEGLSTSVFKDENTLYVAEPTNELGTYDGTESPYAYQGTFYWEVDYHTGQKVDKVLTVDPWIARQGGYTYFDYSHSLDMFALNGYTLFLVEPNTTVFYQLFENESDAFYPQFSPEGKRILFTATVGNGLGHPDNLFIYDVASQTIERMLPDEITYSDSSLAVPDGQPYGTSLNQ